MLDADLAALNSQQNLKIEIDGHADPSEGTEAETWKLTEWRAGYVKSYFELKGISPDRLSTRAYGSTQPIALRNTVDGRALNPRVELKIVSNMPDVPPAVVAPPPPATPPPDPSDPQLVDKLLANLHSAAILYDAPRSIEQGSYAVFTVELSPQKSADDLLAQRKAQINHAPPSADSGEPSQPTTSDEDSGSGNARNLTTDVTKIANYVTASLVGAGVDISAPAEISQLVSNSDVTQFSWIVSAKDPGRYSLIFTLSTQLDVGGAKPYRLKTTQFDLVVKPLDVKARARDWVNTHLIPILTGILGQLGLLIWNEIKLRMKGSKEPSNDDSKDEPGSDAPEAGSAAPAGEH